MDPQRWGDPARAESLSPEARGLVELAFGAGPRREPGPVGTPPATRLDATVLDALTALLGPEHVLTDDATRTLRPRGKSTPDLLRASSAEDWDTAKALHKDIEQAERAADMAVLKEAEAEKAAVARGVERAAAQRAKSQRVAAQLAVQQRGKKEKKKAQKKVDELKGVEEAGEPGDDVDGQHATGRRRHRHVVELDVAAKAGDEGDVGGVRTGGDPHHRLAGGPAGRGAAVPRALPTRLAALGILQG